MSAQEHILTYSHSLTRIFAVRCSCGFLTTTGTQNSAEKRGEEHLLVVRLDDPLTDEDVAPYLVDLESSQASEEQARADVTRLLKRVNDGD